MPVVGEKLLLQPNKMSFSNLKSILKGKVVIVGIGNILRGDDGFGPALISRLQGKLKALCIDAGTAPENYTGKIVKGNPNTILLVDALHLDKNAGEFELLKKEDIVKVGFTTHDISPNMFIEYLEKNTAANIYMLGVQPKSVSFGEEMSDEVKGALEQITNLICMSHT